ncbi:MAG: hypothetical protein HKO53_08070, partial [Gemmatimonadetes bacterium]|nr:hypothetical protein [Gemmatimonadota bacterium]
RMHHDTWSWWRLFNGFARLEIARLHRETGDAARATDLAAALRRVSPNADPAWNRWLDQVTTP